MITLHTRLGLSDIAWGAGMGGRGSKKRVLCFGDSLTAGYRKAKESTPYGTQLRERLGEKYEVVVSGVPGETTGEMVVRIEEVIKKAKEGGGRMFDLAVVLGGTNDVARKVPAEEVMANLTAIHQALHAEGCKTIALGIPQHYQMFMHGGYFAQVRDTINESLEKLSLSVHAIRAQQMTFLTLDPRLPYFDPTTTTPSELHSDLWDDGIHFSEKGYTQLGTCVADHILNNHILEPLQNRPK